MDFFVWLLALLPSQLRHLEEIPRKAFAYLLTQEPSWHLSDDLASGIAEAAEHPSSEIEDPAILPSKGVSSYHPEKNFANTVIVYQALQGSAPSLLRSGVPSNLEAGPQSVAQTPESASSYTPNGSMSPLTNQVPNDTHSTSVSQFSASEVYSMPTNFVLYWQSQTPSGDFDTYIWQPYRKPPPFSYVKFHIINTESPRNLKMILLFNDTRSLCAFRTRHQELTRQRVPDEAWSPITELIRSISAISTTMLSDTVGFMQCCSKEVNRLVWSTWIDNESRLIYADEAIDIRGSRSSSCRKDTVPDTFE